MISWIKISTGTFGDEKVRLIEAMPEGDALLVIWFKLLVQAGKCNANGNVTLTEGLPFNDEMLSVLFNRQINTVRLALKVFHDMRMIEVDEGVIKILNWGKHQNLQALEKIKEQTRLRVANYRAKQKTKLLEGGNATVALHNSEVTQQNKNKNKNKEYMSEILALSDLLAQRILSNNPQHTKLSDGKYHETVQRWAADIEKLHQIDKQTVEDIRAVIEWCQEDSFWKSGKIISGATLRKQWDKLYPQAVKQIGKLQKATTPQSAADNILDRINAAERAIAEERVNA